MSYTVNLSWGSNSVDLHNYNGENLILSDGFSKTVTLHNNLKPVQDKANMRILWRTSLASTLIEIDPDITVTVDIRRNGSAWFYGYLRPVTKWSDTGTPGSTIDLEVLDNSWRLKRRIRTTQEHISKSVDYIIGQLVLDAGYTESFIEIPSISTVVGYYLEPGRDGEEDARSYWDAIRELLFAHGYTFYFDSAGVFQLYDWSAQTIPTPAGFINDNNVVGTLEAERDIPEFDGVEVEWKELKTAEKMLILNKRVSATYGPSEKVYLPAGAEPTFFRYDTGDS